MIVRRVVRQRAKGESVFVQVSGVVDEIDDEVSAAHVMGEIAEVLVAERVVTHVLYQRSAIGKGVRLFQILRGRCRETFLEQRLNVILPKKVDDFFMREYGICAANLRQADKQPKAQQHCMPRKWKSSHKAHASARRPLAR